MTDRVTLARGLSVAMKVVDGRVRGQIKGHRHSVRVEDDPPRRGGQAEVYRGVTEQGTVVAVKVALEGEDQRRGLLAEREALRGIHQRNRGATWLVPLLDEGDLPDGRPFLVLPWVEHSMHTWLRVRQPDLRLRLRALVLTAEAVVQLHRSASSLAGVVLHRDLKPGNLLVKEVGGDLRVMLADLGGAKERTLHGATRNTGIHTPWFAPLEQALPLERAADPSVDVHALAVVIYAVLAGRAPQTTMSRSGLLTQAADDLVQLHSVGGGRTAEERARYVELRRAPLEHLIELDQAVALSDEDCKRLHLAVQQQLPEQGEAAERLADRLTSILVPSLRHALDPNPRQRLSRPEALLGALTAALECLPAPPSVAEVMEVETLAAPPAPRSPTPGPRARSHGQERKQRLPWRLMAILGGAASLIGGCAALIVLPPMLRPTVEVGLADAGMSGPAPAAEATSVQAAPEASPPLTTGPTVQVAHVSAAPAPNPDRRSAAAATPAVDQTDQSPQSEVQAAPAEEALGEAVAVVEPPREKPTVTVRRPEPSSPPRLVISMDPRRGSSPYVWLNGDRATQGGAWQGAMVTSSLEVVIRASADGPPRRFKLRREAVDATHWRVLLVDTLGPQAERIVSVPEEGSPEKVLVQWCQDDAVRFGC